jgi:hypothetical protein
MPPRRSKATVADEATPPERVRVITPPPPTAGNDGKASADQIYNQIVNSMPATYVPNEYTPRDSTPGNYSPGEYTPRDEPYVPRDEPYTPRDEPYVPYTPAATYAPVASSYAPAAAVTSATPVGNAYGSNSFPYSQSTATPAYNSGAYNPNAYNPNAYNPNASAKPRYSTNDASYNRRRSRSPPRGSPRRRSPGRRRSPSPYDRRRSPSPRGSSPASHGGRFQNNNNNNNRRRAPAIPTVVALDLLSWIPAHIWREHGYQPPVKLS